MNRKKILITRLFPKIGFEMLVNAGFEITQWDKDRPMTDSELLEWSKGKDGIFCTLTDKIDKYFLEQNPQLEVISQFAVGYDNIDIAEATKLGIPVGYTPDVLSDATADVAFGLMIAVARKIFHNQKSIIDGEWGYFKPNHNLGMDLKHKTLGILGLGRIGIEMARRCKGAYNMNVLYHNRNANEEAEKELGAELVDFETLLEKSDVLSVHCALTPETKGLFDAKVFQRMKQTAVFINTARGLVHNEEDLTDALQKGIIWGAGLDVTNPEPMQANNILLSMQNVVITPHIGSATIDTRNKMAEICANNIIEFYNSHKMTHCVNF